jgi:hypothetical protein
MLSTISIMASLYCHNLPRNFLTVTEQGFELEKKIGQTTNHLEFRPLRHLPRCMATLVSGEA